MAENVKSKIDILKERLFCFVKEGNSFTELKVPNRIMIGFKLDNVAVVIRDLLNNKYNKNLQLVAYDKHGDNDYLFTFKE